MKIWDKGFEVDPKVTAFTVGNDRELDLKLAKYDVQGSLAHGEMLHEIGLLEAEEWKKLRGGLNQIAKEIAAGNFEIEEGFEDVHSKVEFLLTQRLGEVGKKIHSARSRNDQVLVDLHLYTKDAIQDIKSLIKDLFDCFLRLAEEHKEVILPGYTHLQVAMPSSFGLWFSAYAETLIDDVHLLNAAKAIADQNPLGSAAGYGSSFPINRSLTTEILGFKTTKYNVVAAQMGRGKLERSVGYALASVASTLAKFADDVCLYMCQNFGFISFPKELTTGSSIMPHKKNPDIFELLRAKCNQIQAYPNEVALLTGNLSSGYHRDLQLLKEGYLSNIDRLKDCLQVCEYMLQHIQVNPDAAKGQIYQHMYSVERVNGLVMQGTSFRDAYVQVGQEIEAGDAGLEHKLSHTHEGSLGNLCLDAIALKFNEVL